MLLKVPTCISHVEKYDKAVPKTFIEVKGYILGLISESLDMVNIFPTLNSLPFINVTLITPIFSNKITHIFVDILSGI